MGKFDKYFLMAAPDAVEYALAKLPGFGWDRPTMGAEEIIGDGLVNHVFRVRDGAAHSAVIKQAGPAVRTAAGIKASPDRNRLEAEILRLQGRLAPGMVPEVYFYDTAMAACAMEDLSGQRLMRQAMLEHETFPNYANDITTFMVNTLLMTSDVALGHKEKKALARRFVSPDMSQLIEDLVLTFPYDGTPDHSRVSAPNASFARRELHGDDRLRLAVAKLKFKFMTEAQALLHGDLHTASVFVGRGPTKVFDPEFAAFAPMGYDVGNVVANLVFAYGHGLAHGAGGFCQWCLDMVEQVIELFAAKFSRKFDQAATEPMAKVPGFKEWYLGGVLSDTAGYAGAQIHRCTMGLPHVRDITTIADPAWRARVERLYIWLGKDFILNQDTFRRGEDFVGAIKRAEGQARRS